MMESFPQNHHEESDEVTPENITRWAEETEAYNEIQLQLAIHLHPDMEPSEAMMAWVEDEKRYSAKFRELMKSNEELRQRVLSGDESVIEEIEKKLYE